MANISCAELFTDATFSTAVQLFSRVSRVNDYGENEIQMDSGTIVLMVVQPDREALTSRPDSRFLTDSIKVWYKGKLYAEGQLDYCSAIKWRGRFYRVTEILDWTESVNGWASARCIAWELNNDDRQ